MKKILITALICVGFILPAAADHIKGGFFSYTYLGPGTVNPNASRYNVKLTIYMHCNATGAQISNPINFSIFDGVTNAFLRNESVSLTREYLLQKGIDDQCISGDQTGCYYKIVEYERAIELDPNPNGYTLAYQRCCRISNVVNISNSNTVGNTWATTIPGTGVHPTGPINSSPGFQVNDTAVICAGSPFEYPFLASDPDGDSLAYVLCEGWAGGSQADAAPAVASNPPYTSVPYTFPFSGTQPLGSGVTINSQTGLISGVAPSTQGEYVLTVCVNEFRNGILIGVTRKELHVRALGCQPITPQLNPNYITCDGFTLTFQNLNPNPNINSYFWDFGVPSVTNDTSNVAVPTYTYSDTGTYTIKLVVNRGQGCSDSTTALAKVYPGFFPGFTSSGICVGRPTQFTDTTRTQYGVVDTWGWNFGNPSVTNDTSHLQNPTYTYTQVGTYNVQFIVTNSKGCRDTVNQNVTIIDKPPLSVAFADTLICSADDVTLQAIGNGAFNWTPSATITSGGNTATPTVDPPSTQWYFVELNDNGCVARDSVRVRVVDFVTLNMMGDSTICEGDQAQLHAVTDGFQFNWTPAATLNNPNILSPIATPLTTTPYQLTSFIGSCSETATVTITVAPYPVANAGGDVEICFGGSAQLNGSVSGTTFMWSPTTGLSNPNILNPVATPGSTTSYILSSLGNSACPKPGRDTVVVEVLPDINAFAGNDTLIVVGQPLQLNAVGAGGTGFVWSPATGLSAVDIADPVANLPQNLDSIRYTVHITNNAGCTDSSSINVKVFKTNPQVFVPTGFTPNGDGKNDLIRPIAVGMKKINYFRVYNRWGQLVFSTQINGHGWDGRIGGVMQGTGVFVWLVEGIDYLDRPFFRKGTVTLIR